jgi:hypothetical protein
VQTQNDSNSPQNVHNIFFNHNPVKFLFYWKEPLKIDPTQVIEIPKLFLISTFIEQGLIFSQKSLYNLKNIPNEEKIELIYSLLCYVCNIEIEFERETRYLLKLIIGKYKYFGNCPNNLIYTLQDLKNFFDLLHKKLRISN